MSKLKKEKPRNHSVWLKCFIKAMKESLRTGLRFHPRDDDVIMLQQIKEMIQKPKVTEEWIEEKAKEFYKKALYVLRPLEHKDIKDFIRSLVEEAK